MSVTNMALKTGILFWQPSDMAALKEGQIVNKLNEEHLKTKKAEVTDKEVLEEIVAS